jgi:hypothetical protein
MTANDKLSKVIAELGQELYIYPDFSWENPLTMFKKESAIVNATFDSKRFLDDYNERIEDLRRERREIEEQYGESTRVPEKWGYDVWIATIEGETSNLTQHSYTILELRNVIQAMWDDIDDEEFNQLEIPWQMKELEAIYRRMYEVLQNTDLENLEVEDLNDYWQYA